MKELSIEQKAKAYDKAIKRIQSYVVDEYGCTRIKVVNVFPELAESEDEKIRKYIISFIELNSGVNLPPDDAKEMLAWLEKQGEQNLPIEKLPLEMKTVSESLGFTTKKECDDYNKMVTDLIMSDNGKGEQKPAWSKEDEANLNEALSYIKDDALKEFIKSLRPQRNVGYNPYKAVVESITKMVEKYESIISNKVDAVDFLNEVRAKCNEAKQYDVKYPQLQWKPSEEQLYYLSWITNIKLCDSVVEQEASKHLNKLYEQLKQL